MKEHVDKYLIHGKACGDDYIKKLEAKIAVLEAIRGEQLAIEIHGKGYYIEPAAYHHIKELTAALQEIARDGKGFGGLYSEVIDRKGIAKAALKQEE